MDLSSQAGGATPVPGGDGPSREEVQQRISSLYDQAENVSGNFNSTRAMSAGRPRERVKPLPDAGPGRGRTEKAVAAEGTLSERAKQWFDVGRSQLGPFVPAALPTDRMPDGGGAGGRPKGPAGRPGDRPADRALEAAGRPVLELTAGSTAGTVAWPVAELTAGPVAALPALPAAREAAATEVLPALVTEPRQSLQSSKARNQSKLAKARELLSAHIAQRNTPLAAIEPPRSENTWRTSEAQNYGPPAGGEWWQPQPQPQPQPQSAGLGTELSPASMGPDLTLGMGLAAGPDATLGTGLSAGPDLTFGMGFLSSGAGLPVGSDGASDQGYGGKAAKAVDFARGQIGKPCVWGAMGPGSYDCSSLTQAAWKTAGVALPRTVPDQATAGPSVPLSDIRLGDLVLFHGQVGHVGIYSGNGMMVHAPSPGAAIREESIHWAGESAIHSVVRPA